MTHASLFLVVISIAATGIETAAATIIEVEADSRGQYQHTGFANGDSPVNNFNTGDCSGPVGRCFGERASRSWFLFDLSSLSTSALAATLYLDVPAPSNSGGPGYASTSAESETYTLFDVSPANLRSLGKSSVSIWSDLGSGLSYGSHVATVGDVGQTIAIDLNSLAIAYINDARGGDFAIGGAITTLNEVPDDEYLFGFSSGHVSRLELLVPEPSTASLLGLSLLWLAVRARRRIPPRPGPGEGACPSR